MSFLACAMVNVAICAAIGVGIYVTSSPWCLLALIFLMQVKTRED